MIWLMEASIRKWSARYYPSRRGSVRKRAVSGQCYSHFTCNLLPLRSPSGWGGKAGGTPPRQPVEQVGQAAVDIVDVEGRDQHEAETR